MVLGITETIIADKMIAGSVNKSPKAAIIGVETLSGSHPCSKLLREINIVTGNITIVEIMPPIIEIRVKSTKPILSKPNIIHTPLAKKAKNIDNIKVRINDDKIFSDNTLERLSSGDNKPICRFVESLDPKAPKIFPLIPIAPGIITNNPGNAIKKSSIFPRKIPAHNPPTAHIKRAVRDSLSTELVSLKKDLNLCPSI